MAASSNPRNAPWAVRRKPDGASSRIERVSIPSFLATPFMAFRGDGTIERRINVTIPGGAALPDGTRVDGHSFWVPESCAAKPKAGACDGMLILALRSDVTFGLVRPDGSHLELGGDVLATLIRSISEPPDSREGVVATS